MAPQHFEDPVAAYDQLALQYAQLSLRRAAYLRAVENLIVSRIPTGSRSLLDIGSGDGKRAIRIAKQAGIERLVLLEPAAKMSAQGSGKEELWTARAEDLDPASIPERFDVITCLWNVLGHVPTPEKRATVLRNVGGLLSERGAFFLDVIHRYNARTYGITPSFVRWVRDSLAWSQTNGDVRAKWLGGAVSTYGHVFTHREILRLARAAGLELQQRIIVDYDNGQQRRMAWMGNLLYIFRRSSRIDSPSAPQTS